MLDFQSTLNTIKSRGYWQVSIHPSLVRENVVESVGKAKEIIRTSVVHFRGWDYPHYPTRKRDHADLYVGENNSVEGWIDFENYKEVWRYATNGQFIHLFGMREDWWEENSWINAKDSLRNIKPGEVLGVISTVYTLTEIYAFLSNLAQHQQIVEGFTVDISLVGTKNRSLYISDSRRAPLSMEYESRLKDVILPSKTYERDLLISNYVELAFEQIIYLFNCFNWDNPNIPVIKEDQKRLIERRF